MKFDAQKLSQPIKSPKTKAALEQLAGFINADPNWKDLRHIAYFLATAQHETAGTFLPIPEYRARAGSKGRRNQDRYWLTGYYGRGYVQLTWDYNYRKAGKRIGVGDLLLKNPEAALQPEIAYKVAVFGMYDGLFTGHDLDDYIQGKNATTRVRARSSTGKTRMMRLPHLPANGKSGCVLL